MAYIDLISKIHKKTQRNYLERMTEDKPEIIETAKRYDYDYWDGNRRTGYGGYKYDGRWRIVADELRDHYGLKAGDKVLDIGCGKGFLMYDLTQSVPDIEVKGIDISEYAIEHAKEEIKENLQVAPAQKLPFGDNEFDLAISINTLHNLYLYDLKDALQEMERVAKNKYLVVEAYRNEREKFNLMCWVLTGECFFSDKEWEWLFKEYEYAGDYSFIYFE